MSTELATAPEQDTDRRAVAVALLRQWAAEAEELTDEEAADNAAVLRSLDAARPSDRPLFADLLAENP